MKENKEKKSHYKVRFNNILPNIVTVQTYSNDEFLEARYEDDESFFSTKKLFQLMLSSYIRFGALGAHDRLSMLLREPTEVPIKFSKRYDPISVFNSYYDNGTLKWVNDGLLPEKDMIFVPKKYATKADLASVIVIRPAIPENIYYQSTLSLGLQGPSL